LLSARRMPIIALAGLATVAAPAFAAPSERRIRDWPPMSIGLSGNGVAYATSTTTTIAIGRPYTVHRTDTYRLPLAGARLTGARIDGMVLRPSPGHTTAGPIFGDDPARYRILATARGFPPQARF